MTWPSIDDRVVRQWKDDQEATEYGASGIAILLISELTEYEVLERSYKGTGFDYWLTRQGDRFLQAAARLEVSGIRQGEKQTIDERVRRKIQQTKRSDLTHSMYPAFVIVVEFGTPVAVVEQR